MISPRRAGSSLALASSSILLVLAACGSPTATTDAGPRVDGGRRVDGAALDATHPDAAPADALGVDAPGTPPADAGPASEAPGVGAHALVFHRYDTDAPTNVTTPPSTTRASGSTILVALARGSAPAFAPGDEPVLPTDSEGNAPYALLDGVHTYTRWPGSGTALYAFTSAVGGADFIVGVESPSVDETTLAMVEITSSSRIADVAWTEVLDGSLRSGSVTTSGPATLVAVWYGDGDGSDPHTAEPDSGFTVIESALEAGWLVQCAVAVKTVDAAGTYDVTWTATETQGAQLWLVAVE
jgi:hypothetical protein